MLLHFLNPMDLIRDNLSVKDQLLGIEPRTQVRGNRWAQERYLYRSDIEEKPPP